MAKNDVYRIGILGAESTGKTWLAERLATHFNTEWVPEYARSYFETADIDQYDKRDLIAIARQQVTMENELASKSDTLLFCDTTVITVKIWSQLEFGNVPIEIANLVAKQSHDYYLILDNSVDWEEDALRKNRFDRREVMNANISEVLRTGKGYAIIEGGPLARLKSAITTVDGYLMGKK